MFVQSPSSPCRPQVSRRRSSVLKLGMSKITAEALFQYLRKIPEEERRFRTVRIRDINDEVAEVVDFFACTSCVSLVVDSSFEVKDAK